MLLAAAFALTALLYASVGFGGGSTYNALLILADTDFALVPVIALLCNLIVVTGGAIRFVRADQVPWRRLWPILLLSAPCAWAGGLTPISKQDFALLLGSALVLAAALMLIRPSDQAGEGDQRWPDWIGWPIGMGIGYLAGLVGIGGGIFLAPVLHLMRWHDARRIAASACLFILVNSLSGLVGQISKAPDLLLGEGGVASHWMLFAAVLLGGQIGTHLGVRLLPLWAIRAGTAVLTLYVGARLLLGW